MFKEIENDLVNLLHQIKEVLDKHNIKFWLECGTLLGAVRNGKFIPWEHDLDFSAWSEKVSQDARVSIAKAFCDKGFKTYIAENHMNIIKEQNGDEDFDFYYADINFYHINNDEAIKPTLFPKNILGKFLSGWLPVLSAPYHPRQVSKIKSPVKRFIMKNLINITRAMSSLLRKRFTQIVSAVYEKIGSEDVSWIVPSKYFSDLSTMRFYGMEFRVPAKTEEYLAYRYGKDWQTPRVNWTTHKDDGAVSSLDKKI